MVKLLTHLAIATAIAIAATGRCVAQTTITPLGCSTEDEPDVWLYWLEVGTGTITCGNGAFTVSGGYDNYPTIHVTYDSTDSTYDLTIISNEDDDGLTFEVNTRDPDLKFGLLRVVTPDNEPNHDVTLRLGGAYPIESIEKLGAFVDVMESYDLAARIGLFASISGVDVEGEIGTMVLHQIYFTLRTGGNVGSLATAAAPMTVVNHIATLDVGGDLLGALQVSDDDGAGESIQDLIVRGRMGYASPSGANQEAAGDISTKGSIQFLQTSEVGPAVDIDVGVTLDGPAPIGKLDVTDLYSGSGDFNGALTASTVDADGSNDHQIVIDGDLNGVMTFADPITDHSAALPAIYVNGSFGADGLIELPEEGLAGQIVFNGADDPNSWNSGGEVHVDTYTLSGPDYTDTAAELGGGAAGLAPFGMHYESCDPPTEDSVAVPIHIEGQLELQGLELACVHPGSSIDLQFYGPIETVESPLHVVVERYNGSAWAAASGSFTSSLYPGGESKRVRVTRTSNWTLGGSYRIRNRTDYLLSATVDGTPEVAAYEYFFDIYLESCEGMLLSGGYDLNSDDAVTTAGDLPAWFLAPVDFNGDSETDGDDYMILESACELYASCGS